jgi:hypothetical protein
MQSLYYTVLYGKVRLSPSPLGQLGKSGCLIPDPGRNPESPAVNLLGMPILYQQLSEVKSPFLSQVVRIL